MWQNQRGDQSQVQPHRAAQTSQDAATSSAACGEHPASASTVACSVQPPAPRELPSRRSIVGMH